MSKETRKNRIQRYTYFSFDGTSKPKYNEEVKSINFENKYIRMKRAMSVNSVIDKLGITVEGVKNIKELRAIERDRQEELRRIEQDKYFLESIKWHERYEEWLKQQKNCDTK